MVPAFAATAALLPRRPRRLRGPSCALCAAPSHGANDNGAARGASSEMWQVPQPERVVLRGTAHDNELLAATHTLEHTRELSAHIALLRRHKLALLLDDVACHLRSASPTLRPIAARANLLGDALLALPADEGDGASRADARALLWEARVALAPLAPPPATPLALERARGALLDVATSSAPARRSALRAEVYALLIENTLLEELRSLHVLERAVRAAARAARIPVPPVLARELRALRAAAAALGTDNYRVRGKAGVAAAVRLVRAAAPLGALADALASPCARLHDAVVRSLETDLAARRPHGAAMLLRPAMHDIPNFEVVDDHILRGGQPTSAGVAWLSDYGVSHFVDLRGSDRSNQWAVDVASGKERDGALFTNLAIEDFSTPSLPQVIEFIRLMDAVRKHKTVAFVHCKAGIGRTGVMISCWRIFHGASPDEALCKERLYSPDGGGLKQEQFVRDFETYCMPFR